MTSCTLSLSDVETTVSFLPKKFADSSPTLINNNRYSATNFTKVLEQNGYCGDSISEDGKREALTSPFKAPFINELPSKMPESSWNDMSPPKNGSHFLNEQRKGFKPVAVVNGCAKGRISTPFNGFHYQETIKAIPEKTVGHGRPRYHWQSPRVCSATESAPGGHGQGERMYEQIAGRVRPGLQGRSKEELNGFNFAPMEAANYEDSLVVQQNGNCISGTTRDLFLRHRGPDVPEFDTRSGHFNGTADQHQSRRRFYSEDGTFHDFGKVNLREEMPVEDTGVTKLQLELSKRFEFPRMNGWGHCARTVSEDVPLDRGEKRIFELLRNNGPLVAGDIATLGVDTEDRVNHCLFTLYRRGLVEISGSSPPLYAVSDSFLHKGPRSPGVIGAERKQETFIRGRSHSDDWCERQRRHSYGSRESRQRQESRVVDNARASARSNGLHGAIPSEPRISPYFCKYCKLPFQSAAQFEEHLQSTKHQNKYAKYNAVPYRKFCEYCKVHLNSESQAKEHFNSGRHEQTVAKSQKAPLKQHLPLVSFTQEPYLETTTRTEPYSYQRELYGKAMTANSVCFLPTGSGKTLVAALVIAHMLKLNPCRQVVFLVDRVLLVLQQSDYLRSELSHIRVADEGSSNSFNGTRPIRIGAVCGEMRKLEGNSRIYEQDVLIITADCYRNHLNNGTLRFEDVSLIVLDEAHHCNKDHPYNVIIRDFYLREDDLLGHRPKVLGLTASPAGELSLDKTTKRLQRLLGNLDDARLLNVSHSMQKLDEKTNKAPPECVTALCTPPEEELRDALMEYVTKAFNLTVRLSEMKDYKDIFQPSSGGLFSIDDVHPVLRVTDKIILSRPDSNALSALLHFQIICEAICALQECGRQVALNQMAELAGEGCPHGFQWAESMGLPSSQLCSHFDQYFCPGLLWRPNLARTASAADQLVEYLSKETWHGVCGQRAAWVLVLVTRKRTASHLANYLSSSPQLQARGITSVCLKDQGSGSGEQDLVAFEPGEVLQRICDGFVQIVVSTSAPEDSLGLPSCQLVVQMNPLSSTQALTQIRARSQAARFVCISRNEEQAKKIEDLLRREENMKRAVRILNG